VVLWKPITSPKRTAPEILAAATHQPLDLSTW
jgi:hypothetical protein